MNKLIFSDFKEGYKEIMNFCCDDNAIRWELFRLENLVKESDENYNNDMLEVIREITEQRKLEPISIDELLIEYYTQLTFCEYRIIFKTKDYHLLVVQLENMKKYPHMPKNYIKWINELITLISEEIGEHEYVEINNTPDSKNREKLDFVNFL